MKIASGQLRKAIGKVVRQVADQNQQGQDRADVKGKANGAEAAGLVAANDMFEQGTASLKGVLYAITKQGRVSAGAFEGIGPAGDLPPEERLKSILAGYDPKNSNADEIAERIAADPELLAALTKEHQLQLIRGMSQTGEDLGLMREATERRGRGKPRAEHLQGNTSPWLILDRIVYDAHTTGRNFPPNLITADLPADHQALQPLAPTCGAETLSRRLQETARALVGFEKGMDFVLQSLVLPALAIEERGSLRGRELERGFEQLFSVLMKIFRHRVAPMVSGGAFV